MTMFTLFDAESLCPIDPHRHLFRANHEGEGRSLVYLQELPLETT